MLQSNAKFNELASPRSELLSPAELLFRAVAIVRRHLRICIGVPAAFIVLALIYLLTTSPQFTAISVMVIDMRRSASLQQPGASNVVETPIDNPAVESQAEILKSENIALKVIRDLKLIDDPDFMGSSIIGSLIGAVRGLFSRSEPTSEFELMRAAVEQFEKRLTIKRIGVTFVFEIGFTDPSRERAAKIANAVAESYVDDQLEAKYSSAKRAGTWLQDRLKEIGKQAADAERAVVDYKSRNSIVDTGGRLMNEQQLSELNSQLSVARANASEAAAKLARVQDVMRQDVPDANVTDALHNEVIIKLRGQYTDLAKRAADLTNRIGPEHQAVVNVRNDMREVRKSILEELGRIAAGYQSDYQISKARLDSIEASLSKVVSQSETTNKAQVELKELDSAAQSYRTLYDSFLQRYMESVQQQSFPLTEARVVTKATPPLKKSQPKSLITLLGALVGGSVVGFGVAWFRELSDRTLRTANDIEMQLGVACISSVPLLKNVNQQPGAAQPLADVVARPSSRFAESIRAIKLAVDFFPGTRKTQVIGVISSLPGEGKSTIAANLAALVADSGARAVLVDGDLRNQTLTKQLAPNVNIGLLEVLVGQPTSRATFQLRDQRCHFIPSVLQKTNPSSSEFISSPKMKALLEHLKAQYDYVIVDLPPLVPVTDARAAADLIDCFIMVVEWGRTSADLVQSSLQMSSRIQAKIVGVALNKVDGATAHHYYSHEFLDSKNAYYSG
jgi:succinoglycan biosynthesis transport protein ExoP